MGRSKENKKVVGSANGSAALGEGEDGSSAAFALGEMGLQALPTGAAGGFGEEITSVAQPGAPALSTLDDVTSQPVEVDPSSVTAAEGGETAAASLAIEQQGEAAREAAREGREGQQGGGDEGCEAAAQGRCCARGGRSRTYKPRSRRQGV